MGLDTTHDCWHGPYSSFNNWRRAICAAGGFASLEKYEGFGGDYKWPNGDVLVELLNHSDCDGELHWEICGDLADRLEQLLPDMRRADYDGYLLAKTQQFIEGLRDAHAARENVEFH